MALSEALQKLWQRSKPQAEARIALLQTAAESAANGTLTPESRTEAAATAHKLAGSLGMFGYPQGTHAARMLEQEFDQPNPNPTTLEREVTNLRNSIA